MRLREIAEVLDLGVRFGGDALEREVMRGYMSDLMSDVLANGRDGDVWVTLQTHLNIVAVAGLRGIVGIVLVNGREPEADTLEKASSEGIAILTTGLPAFEIVGRLYRLGVTGLSA